MLTTKRPRPPLATIVLAVAVCAGWTDSVASETCPDGNLLARAPAEQSYDAYHTRRITDGVVAVEGGHWMSDVNSLFTSAGFVVYRLPAPTRIRWLVLQADNNDQYLVSGSMDGQRWTPLWLAPTTGQPGVRLRYGDAPDVPVRFLRLAPLRGDGIYSVGELAVYCRRPDPWPPEFPAREGVVRDAAWAEARNRRLAWGKVVSGIIGGTLVVLVLASRRWGRRAPRWSERGLLIVVAATGALAWTNFGTLHGSPHGTDPLHIHELFHYVVGSKYFAENRYTLIYHCTEVAEAEMGRRAFVDRRVIRNLETNRLEPAAHALENPEPCRQAFSPARWEAFKQDVEFFRRNTFPGDWAEILRDYGYNATPLWTLAGSWLTGRGSMSRQVRMLALVDPLLYIGIFGMILWAFGLEACALAALVWGVGQPWGFEWTGGAFGRVPWLFTAVAAVCLLKRGFFLGGGFALAASALLRLFPAALGAGLAILIGHELYRSGGIRPEHRRLVAGGLVAMALLVPPSLATGGWTAWSQFIDNSIKHRETALGNLMGLPTILAWHPERTQAKLVGNNLGDYEVWRETRRATFEARRAYYWPVAIGLLVLTGLFALRNAAPAWEVVAGSALLIFAFLELTCYYYVFLILMAPLAIQRLRRVATLILAVVTSQLIGLSVASVDTRYALESLLFLLAVAYLLVDEVALRAASRAPCRARVR